MSNAGFNQFRGDVNTQNVKYIADPQLRNIVNVRSIPIINHFQRIWRVPWPLKY